MWYLIIALIVFALEWSFLFAFDRAKSKRFNAVSPIINDFEALFPWAIVFLIGALAWPLSILIVISIIMFNTVLKEPFEKLSEWIYEHM